MGSKFKVAGLLALGAVAGALTTMQLQASARNSLSSLPLEDIQRLTDVFERIKNDWAIWNDTMLAERPRPAPYYNPGNFVADHYGVVNPAPTPAPASAAQR